MRSMLLLLVVDTLMILENNRRRFSKTSLTMLSAWLVVLSFAIIDFIKNGLRFDVWIVLVGVASGVSGIDAVSKRIRNIK